MSNADANQVKFTHAHQIAKNTCRNGTTELERVAGPDRAREVVRQGRDGDHEGEVEQQLELARGAVWLVASSGRSCGCGWAGSRTARTEHAARVCDVSQTPRLSGLAV